MTSPRLSSDMIHASTVARDGRAVLITGASGAGKSDLALRLIDGGFQLVSDDQTLVKREGDQLLASAPPTIAGKIEIRGIGILDIGHIDNVPVALVVELASDIERLPESDRTRQILGLSLPLIGVDAKTASAAAKVAISIEHLGRR